MHDTLLKYAQLIFVVIFLHEVLQEVVHLHLVDILVHGQKVVADIRCIDSQFFWALRVLVFLVVKLGRESRLHNKPRYCQVVGYIAQPVEHLLDIRCLLLLENALHHRRWVHATGHELREVFYFIF